MSLFAGSPSDPNALGLPRGQVLGTYSSYEQARQVVDRLAEQEFDIKQVSIVGTDLRMVERVRGKLTYASVALRSGLQGAIFGALLGMLLSLIDPSQAGFQILTTAAIGAAVWIIMGVIGMSVRKKRGGGFDSIQQLVPTSFDVVCAFEVANRAQQILSGATSTPSTPPGGQQNASSGGPQQQAGPDGGATGSQQPFAPSARVQQQPSAPNGQQGQPAQPGLEGQAASTGPRRRDWSYPDLPDGRPQFGVRLPEAEAQQVRERILKEQGMDPSAPSGTGQFQAPQYGRQGQPAAPSAPAAPQNAPEADADRPGAAAEPNQQATDPRDTSIPAADRPAYPRPPYGRTVEQDQAEKQAEQKDAAEQGPPDPGR